ncbi:MAG: lysophospholipid acyltransferase family protein [Romboutsia sp.]|uniref:lysophospholipid acyltransferase family protein n=1 Tax=Romboutsia sp. TaxID=1965302 RepID=UPI003F31EC5E
MNFLFFKGLFYQVYRFISLIPIYIKFKRNPNKYTLEDKFKVLNDHTRKSLNFCKMKLNISGYENLPDGNVLFVANHANWVDAFILASVIDRPCGMVIAKEANWEKFSFIKGWTNILNCIYIDRKNNRNALKSINKASNLLSETCSIGVFPEGIVTKSDDIFPFRDGAFRMAIKAQVPIVPIHIKNSKDVLVLTSRWTGKAYSKEIDVEILEPVYDHINSSKMKTKEVSTIVRNKFLNSNNTLSEFIL